MKMNAKMIGYVLVYILALYGVIILIRKMMMNEPKKGWFEPYSTLGNITSGSVVNFSKLLKSKSTSTNTNNSLIPNINLTNFNKPYILD
jgi:hypothetical protein